MRRIDRKVDGHTYVLETYNSFQEILDTCNRREVKEDVKYHHDETRKKHGGDFMGTESYEEAVMLLKHGYTKGIEGMKKSIKELEKQGTVQKISFKNDVVGYAPVVPLAIQGVPNCMINNIRVPKKAKVITLVVDMAVSGGTSKESVYEYGKKVVQKLIQLENSGFRVRLEYMKCFNNGSHHTAVSTVIKNENQPLDLKRIMFPLTNVAMQRYISWDWYDRVPNAVFEDDRGRSLSTLSDAKRKRITDVLVSDSKNKYIICYGDNLDEVLKEVR